MNRSIVIRALAAVLLTMASLAEAQQPKRIHRIGYLSYGSVESEKSWLTAFQQGLREVGYSEGENIVIELVASLAYPGGNVTGLSDFHAGVVTKRLELLKEIAPSASRVAVLLNPANPTHPLQLKDIQAAAPVFRVTLLSLEVRGPDDIDRAFTTIGKERPGALLVLGDRLFATHQRRLVELAVKSRLPTIYSQRSFVDAGGLMSYGTNFDDLYRRAATYVDKILRGAKAADLPVEQPTRFELLVNLKTAKALGLTIPRSILIRADKVIE